MILSKGWGSFNLSAASLGTTLTLDSIPQQYPIRRLLITFMGQISITAGGTTDYTAGPMFTQSIIDRIRFKLGSSNYLKNVKGFMNWIQGQLWTPNDRYFLGPDQGTAMGVGYSSPLQCAWTVDFADPGTIQGDRSILVPKLYEDISLELDLNDLADIAGGGNRPFTLTGNINVMLVQDTNVTVAPSDLLKEWIETKDVSATGTFEFELPRSNVLEQINIYGTEAGQASVTTILDTASTDNFELNIESGTFLVYDALMSSITFDQGIQQKAVSIWLTELFFIALNLNQLHDLQDIINPTAPQFKKWSANFPVIYPGATVPRIENHYIGRTSNNV